MFLVRTVVERVHKSATESISRFYSAAARRVWRVSRQLEVVCVRSTPYHPESPFSSRLSERRSVSGTTAAPNIQERSAATISGDSGRRKSMLTALSLFHLEFNFFAPVKKVWLKKIV